MPKLRWFLGMAIGSWLIAAACIAVPAAVEQNPSTHAARVTAGTSVADVWREHQRLYVKGDVGVGEAQLDSLEVWLDENAPHWTVVLTESASGEEYTDLDGRRYQSMDAVDAALGKGLPNRTDFGTLTHPKTGERDGAFFVLYLRERKFSYFASDAQDRRRLGEEYWEGNLDAPAIAAMRSGGRVVDAVKDTILHINRRLEQRISSEAAERERRALTEAANRQQRAAAEKAALARAEVEAKGNLEAATRTLTLVEQKLGEFLRSRTGMSGDLASSNLAQFQAELAAARVAFESANFVGASRMAASARDRLLDQERLLEKHQADAAELARLEAAIAAASIQPHALAGRDLLQAARVDLGRARTEHERGDSSYAVYLSNSQTSLAGAESAIAAADRAARIAQRFWAALVAAVAAGVILLGLYLNRRRRPEMAEATQLLRDWETALGEKSVALFQLLDRVSSVLGSSADVIGARFRGETLRLAREIVQDVDELFIMSACAGRVLREAQALVHPKNLRRRVENFFVSRAYRAAAQRLRDEPIVFRPEEALQLVVGGTRTERDTLIGELESYRPFTMSFTELINAFNTRARRALESLDFVETSLIKVGDRLEAVQKTIDAAREKEPELADAAAVDGFFALSTIFNEVIPAAQSTLSDGVKSAITDAVGALQLYGARAGQQARDAAALTDWVLEFRKQSLREMQAGAEGLESGGVSSAWITDAESALSEQAEGASRAALQGDASEQIERLRSDALELAGRVQRALTLDNERRETAAEAIVEANGLIAAARKEVAAELGIDPHLVVREKNADPSLLTGKASEQIAATQAALERGDVVGARESLDTVLSLCKGASQLIIETRRAMADYSATREERNAESERLTKLLPAHEQILARLQKAYAPAVLLLREGDPGHPNANGTVADNLEETRAHLEAARRAADDAVNAHNDGRVLEAAGVFRQTQAFQESAAVRLLELRQKAERLRETEQANRNLIAPLETRLREAESCAQDPRMVAPTLELMRAQAAAFQSAQINMRASCSDPFKTANELEELQAGLDQLFHRIQSDQALYAEADRTLQTAAAQINRAERLAQQAANDQVPDSPGIMRARSALDPLAPRLAIGRDGLRIPHSDWMALAAEAERIGAEAERVGATLIGELREAEAATSALSAAAAALRQAELWTGAYGVAIGHSSGTADLARAMEQIQRGAYKAGQQAAEIARRAAEQAIAEADAEVLRRRRAEDERLERERRQRTAMEAARRRSSSSASSFGRAFSSGRSSFSSGSGVRRSSFSSGSGVRRSGW